MSMDCKRIKDEEESTVRRQRPERTNGEQQTKKDLGGGKKTGDGKKRSRHRQTSCPREKRRPGTGPDWKLLLVRKERKNKKKRQHDSGQQAEARQEVTKRKVPEPARPNGRNPHLHAKKGETKVNRVKKRSLSRGE